jgi:hypothetical protein
MAGQPGSGDRHVNAMLTQLSIAYVNEMYIAERIFPLVPVNKQSDIVPKYDQSHWFRDEAKLLNSVEAPPAGGYEVDTSDTYFCKGYGIGHLIPDDDRENVDNPFDADQDGVAWLGDRMLMRKERHFVSNFFATSKWGNTDQVGTTHFTKWSTYATSTPIETIRTQKRTIRRAIARNPNKLVLGDLVWDRLEDHPDMLERIKYGASQGSPAMVTPNLVAQLLGLDEVLVGTSIYTADEEGTAEASVAYSVNWDDDALLLYVPSRPSLRNPAAGYTFVWRTALGGPRYIRSRREPLGERADLLEMFENWDMKMTASKAGLFMSDAVD